MKKIFALLLAAALLTVSLTACSSDGSADATPTPTQPRERGRHARPHGGRR